MFNNAKPIVPPMQDRTKGTYAETKAEIEARKRAQMAADAAMLAANEAQNNKKSPWRTVLIALFATIALAAAGFAVYEYTEIDQLKAQLNSANKAYSSSLETIKSYEEKVEALENQLKELKPEEETEKEENVEK